MNKQSPQQLLKDALSERMGSNPRYSLRAFARDLMISPQQLSNVMNGRKGLGPKAAALVADRLGLSKSEREHFCALAQSLHGRSKVSRRLAEAKLAVLQHQAETTHHLGIDTFRVISDWHHFGIVELLKLPGGGNLCVADISKKLGISRLETTMSLERLQKLELIEKTEFGWTVVNETVLTTDGVPSEALRKFHRQILEKATQSVSTQFVEERYLSSSIMAVKTSHLPIARKLIQEFRLKLAEQVGCVDSGQEVYALGIQYFRLTETTSPTKEGVK